jgi:hypothetical protein
MRLGLEKESEVLERKEELAKKQNKVWMRGCIHQTPTEPNKIL